MPAHLDILLAYAIVILALAFVLRPVLYRLIGRKGPASTACHSNSDAACNGGCSTCPVAKRS